MKKTTKKTAETVLALRTCSADMTSYGGFKPVGRRRRSDQTMKLTKWTTPLYNSDGEKVSDEDARKILDGCANDRLGPDCNCGEDMDTIIIPDGTKVPIFDVRIDTTKGVYQVAADMPSQAARALVRHLGKPWTKYRVEVTDHRGFSYYFTATITPHINLEEV